MSVEISGFERNLLLSHPETREVARALLADKYVLIGTADQYNQLRDACANLLQRVGFDEEYSPTNEGFALEGLIDRLLV